MYSADELKYIVDLYAFEKKTDTKNIRIIPKSELVVGQEYEGACRNSSKATWNGKEFIYQRYKFGWYEDTIDHFEDDLEGSTTDCFVPMEVINKD